MIEQEKLVQFASLLIQTRALKRISQKELHQKSGVAISTICLIENGKATQCRKTTLMKLVDALEIDPADVYELLNY